MAYIYKRGKYFWISYYEGDTVYRIRKSLGVSTRDTANILMAEYQFLEAKTKHNSTFLIVKKQASGYLKDK